MNGLLRLFREVGARGSCTRTVSQLVAELALASELGTLGAVIDLSKLLGENGFELFPALNSGDLETPRLIRFARQKGSISNKVLEEIQKGEAWDREFKSTLCFDLKRHVAQPGLTADTYRSDEVLHSSLKTIAAFLNSGGGVLYVGVGDNCEILGIAPDLRLRHMQDRDRWELHLRQCIANYFQNGLLVGQFVSVEFFAHEGHEVARVDVVQRPAKLSFLKHPGTPSAGYQLYRRDGNRTVEVKIEDVEEFLASRSSMRI